VADLRELLDAAAAHAMGDETIDANELLRSADRQGPRRWILWSGLAAATTASIVVLASLVHPSPPDNRPAVLPSRLAMPSPSTPTLSKAPITRASLILQVQNGTGQSSPLTSGLYAVSADDGAYRRIDPVPSGLEAYYTASLSPDGKLLAWLGSRVLDARSRPVVHLLTLKTATTQTIQMPYGQNAGMVEQLDWSADGRRLYAFGDISARAFKNGSLYVQTGIWRINVERRTVGPPTRVEEPAVVMADGTIFSRSAAAPSANIVPLPDALREAGGIVASPTGSSLAGMTAPRDQTGYTLVVSERNGSAKRFAIPQAREARLLAWLPQGIVIDQEFASGQGSSHRPYSFRITAADPRTGALRDLWTMNVPAYWGVHPLSVANPPEDKGGQG
jgi:hypothetical protein